MAAASFRLQELTSTIRFVRGYRYLDRCGEAIIRLEDKLEPGWIPTEIAPKGGVLRNDTLAMRLVFNSESMTVGCSDPLSFDLFVGQLHVVFDVLTDEFRITTINCPTLKATYQIGMESSADADALVRSLRVAEPRPSIVKEMLGTPTSSTYTLCTEEQTMWRDVPVLQRHRLNVSAIMQVAQPAFDERLFRRVRLLPDKQKDALQGLLKLRASWPTMKPAAAEIELEKSFECEIRIKDFSLFDFLKDAEQWQQSTLKVVADPTK